MKSCVIIITYNGMQWIDECLKSVLRSAIPLTLIVVDNASSDGTVPHIKTNFPSVLLLEQKKNLGFGRANNIAMSYALQAEMDYVFLLNQDTSVCENSLKNLIDAAVKYPEYGILSPIQLDYSGDLLEDYFFKFMAKDKSRSFYSDFVLKKEGKDIYNIDFIQAACWLIPIEAIKKIGGFDPIFFHYGEDNNYCQRMLYHNLQIGVVADSFIRHDANKHDEDKVNIYSENYFKLYQRNLLVFYANINEKINSSVVKLERSRIYKGLIISFFTLNYTSTKGLVKKIKVFNATLKQVIISRQKNITSNSHYLDV